MNHVTVIDLAYQALMLVLMLSLPAVLTSALVGVLVGLVQAVTQIQDQSIAQAGKLISVAVVTALSVRWMGGELYQFGESLLRLIATIGTR
jgi:type III secretion protein S